MGCVVCDVKRAMSWQTLPPVVAASVSSSRVADAGAALAAVGDPTATRTVYITVVILAGLGVAMAGLAVWVFRRTRPEPELLAPLETMESRNWRRLDPATQRRLLDDARPAGAAPLRRQASVPHVDRDFSTVAPVTSFADLEDLELDEDQRVERGEPELDELEIDDPVAPADRRAITPDDFDADFDFDAPAEPESVDDVLDGDFATEFDDDPVAARRPGADGDRA